MIIKELKLRKAVTKRFIPSINCPLYDETSKQFVSGAGHRLEHQCSANANKSVMMASLLSGRHNASVQQQPLYDAFRCTARVYPASNFKSDYAMCLVHNQTPISDPSQQALWQEYTNTIAKTVCRYLLDQQFDEPIEPAEKDEACQKFELNEQSVAKFLEELDADDDIGCQKLVEELMRFTLIEQLKQIPMPPGLSPSIIAGRFYRNPRQGKKRFDTPQFVCINIGNCMGVQLENKPLRMHARNIGLAHHNAVPYGFHDVSVDDVDKYSVTDFSCDVDDLFFFMTPNVWQHLDTVEISHGPLAHNSIGINPELFVEKLSALSLLDDASSFNTVLMQHVFDTIEAKRKLAQSNDDYLTTSLAAVRLCPDADRPQLNKEYRLGGRKLEFCPHMSKPVYLDNGAKGLLKSSQGRVVHTEIDSPHKAAIFASTIISPVGPTSPFKMRIPDAAIIQILKGHGHIKPGFAMCLVHGNYPLTYDYVQLPGVDIIAKKMAKLNFMIARQLCMIMLCARLDDPERLAREIRGPSFFSVFRAQHWPQHLETSSNLIFARCFNSNPAAHIARYIGVNIGDSMAVKLDFVKRKLTTVSPAIIPVGRHQSLLQLHQITPEQLNEDHYFDFETVHNTVLFFLSRDAWQKLNPSKQTRHGYNYFSINIDLNTDTENGLVRATTKHRASQLVSTLMHHIMQQTQADAASPTEGPVGGTASIVAARLTDL
jgi:hypothetical protein